MIAEKTRYDVIVIGGGPAGSTSARECAARGLRTLLVEKAEFPRDKPCGGGVNVRAARLLPFDLADVAERRIHGMFISVRGTSGYLRRASSTLTYLTQRRYLDAFLADQALRAGVDIREGAPLQSAERHGVLWKIRAGTQTWTGTSLVAADGANGPTARAAGLAIPRWKGIALEGNISPNGGVPSEWNDVLAVDVGEMPGGYGWLFPKGDHVNIGVGGWSAAGPDLRTKLDALTRFYGFDPQTFWNLRGHPLPVRKPRSLLAHGSFLAVGDAAGLVDPLSGEGIYSAIWSGNLAARHLASFVGGRAPDLAGYQDEIEQGLLDELRTALQLRDLFHLSPRLWAAVVRGSPRVWNAVCNLLTGDLTYQGVKYRVRPLGTAVDVAADAVRFLKHRRSTDYAKSIPLPDRYFRSLL